MICNRLLIKLEAHFDEKLKSINLIPPEIESKAIQLSEIFAKPPQEFFKFVENNKEMNID